MILIVLFSLYLLLSLTFTPKQARDYFDRDRFDSAAVACQYLLEENALGNDTLRCEFLVLLTKSLSIEKPDSAFLATAQEAALLSHQLGQSSTEANMLSHIASYLSEHGDLEGAISTAHLAVEKAAIDTTFSGIIGYINTAKRLSTLYQRADRYEESIVLSKQMLAVLNPIRDTHTDFVNFSEGQVFAQLAYAYSRLFDEEKTRFWLNKAEESVWRQEHPLQAASMLCGVYAKMGMKEEFYRHASIIDSTYIPRQYNTNFIRRIHYSEELADIMARREMETQLHNQQLMMGMGLALLLIAALIVVAVRSRRRHILESQRYNEIIADLKEADTRAEEEEEPKENDHSQLYAQILALMEKKRPFEDPEFDIEQMAYLASTNSKYVSQAINTMTHQNFRSWLGNWRNTELLRLMQEHPDASANWLSMKVGYNNVRALYLQFKRYNGISYSAFVNKQTE